MLEAEDTGAGVHRATHGGRGASAEAPTAAAEAAMERQAPGQLWRSSSLFGAAKDAPEEMAQVCTGVLG